MHSSKHTKHFIYPRRDAWFLLPGFLGFALWYLVPFGMSLAASVMENSANAHFAGLENYAAVMQSSYFRLSQHKDKIRYQYHLNVRSAI